MDISNNIIKEGDKVLLRREKIIFSTSVCSKKKIRFEKTWFFLDEAVGKPYGSTFEVIGNRIKQVQLSQTPMIGADVEVVKDNRNLLDKSANQTLTREEIEVMKKAGDTDNLLEKLIENSATFKDKTEYSQAKYIKKKKHKHCHNFTIVKPTTRLLCEMYFLKSPSKICNLRVDSLSQMLTYGNVRSNSRLLVVESCNGLLLGATLNRMAGEGTLIHLYGGDEAIWSAVHCYNFTNQDYSILHKYPLKRLGRLKTFKPPCDQQTIGDGGDNTDIPEKRCADEIAEPVVPDVDPDVDPDVEPDAEPVVPDVVPDVDPDGEHVEAQEDGVDTEEPATKRQKLSDASENAEVTEEQRKKAQLEQIERHKRRDQREEKLLNAQKQLEEGEFDGLLIACRYYPTPILLKLIELVALSRPVAVFSPFKEPLENCYMALRDRGGVTNMRLTETWMRDYQVLPNRTHPMMNMSNYSGYLLTGITIENVENVQ